MHHLENCLVFVPSDDRLNCHYTRLSEDFDASGVEEGFEAMKTIGEVFSKIFMDARLITVEEYLGFPVFLPADHFTDDQLKEKNQEIIRFLADHRLRVNQEREYPNREMYTFLTEDLMQQELYDLQLKDIYCNFMYELIRPDLKAELEDSVEEFFMVILSNDWRFINAIITDEADIDGFSLSEDKRLLHQKIHSLFGGWNLQGVECFYDPAILNNTVGKMQVSLHLSFQDTRAARIHERVALELEKESEFWIVKKVTGLLNETAVGR